MQFGYGLNYLIDIEHAIIVDIEPTSAGTYDQVAAAARDRSTRLPPPRDFGKEGGPETIVGKFSEGNRVRDRALKSLQS